MIPCSRLLSRYSVILGIESHFDAWKVLPYALTVEQRVAFVLQNTLLKPVVAVKRSALMRRAVEIHHLRVATSDLILLGES